MYFWLFVTSKDPSPPILPIINDFYSELLVSVYSGNFLGRLFYFRGLVILKIFSSPHFLQTLPYLAIFDMIFGLSKLTK